MSAVTLIANRVLALQTSRQPAKTLSSHGVVAAFFQNVRGQLRDLAQTAKGLIERNAIYIRTLCRNLVQRIPICAMLALKSSRIHHAPILGSRMKQAMCRPVPLPADPSSVASHFTSPRFRTCAWSPKIALSSISTHLSTG